MFLESGAIGCRHCWLLQHERGKISPAPSPSVDEVSLSRGPALGGIYLDIIYEKLQTIYLMLYKRQIKKTAKIKNISTNISVSLYI